MFDVLPTPERYDGIAFTYWHSHVPDDRLDEFWDGVAASLAPSVRVLLVDSSPWPADDPTVRERRTESRRLPDGSEHTIAKRYWDPAGLTAELAARGWHGEASTTAHGMILRAVLGRS